MSDHKGFCPLPWLHSYVGLEGYYQICCIGDEFNNFIRDEDGNRIHVNELKKPDEIMNTAYMKEFRLKLLNGELPYECTRCKIVEDLSGTSRRMIENKSHAKEIEQLIDQTGDDGAIETTIKHVDYRTGNTCNLNCRMCNPVSSTRWFNIYDGLPEKYQKLYTVKNNIDDYKNIKWQNEVILEDFDLKNKDIDRLHFAGGESFYVPNMSKILDRCIELDIAKNIVLSYNTNLTILTAALLEKWKSFKEIRLLVSIDAFGELNDYIRPPSKWDTIHQNLVLLDKKHKDYKITEIMVSTTYQMNNALHIPKLVQYLEQFEFVVPVPNLIMLYTPFYLNIKNLPKSLKLIAIYQLQSLKEKYEKMLPAQYQYLLENIDGIAKELSYLAKTTTDSEIKLDLFKEFTDIFDKKRKLSLLDVNPEFEKFL